MRYISGLVCVFLFLIPVFTSAQTQQDKSWVIEPAFTYTGDVFANMAGGVDQGIRYLENVDLSLDFNSTGKAAVPNTRIFLYGIGNRGGNLTELVGDAQVINNIEAENSWRLYEAWAQKIWPEQGISLLAGLYDLNAEFDVINTATFFINSSHGIGAEYGASGLTGPSIFPLTSVGLRLKAALGKRLYFKAAVLDGVPSDPGNTRGTKVYFREDDGLLISGEMSLFSNERSDTWNMSDEDARKSILDRGTGAGYRTKYAVGAWVYTRTPGALPQEVQDETNWGVYAFAETNILQEWGDEDQGLDGYVRIGTANSDINPIGWYAGAGAVYTGLFEGAEKDKTGLAIAWAGEGYRSPAMQSPFDEQSELNIELSHLKSLNSHLSIQGDLQYIVQPGMSSRYSNAFAGGFRIVYTL